MKPIAWSLRRYASSTFQRKTIETLPKALHQHLFNVDTPSTSSQSSVVLDLPKLEGSSLIEHFSIISHKQTEPYYKLLESASKPIFPLEVEHFPEWQLAVGWLRYPHDGSPITRVEHPLEDVFFFDVEVCVIEGNLPTLAVAFSEEAWYCWCSERLVKGTPVPRRSHLKDVIPLGGISERIAIAHNAGYDRARSREPHEKQKNRLRFMDTMSMSIPMYGMADHQQSLHEMDDTSSFFKNSSSLKKHGTLSNERWKGEWGMQVCRNSLSDIHEFLGFGTMDKSERNAFVKDSMDEIRKDFLNLVTYCARDNLACRRIYSKLWPEFCRRHPCRESLAGMLNMGNAYLPINDNWNRFYTESESRYEKERTESARAVVSAANALVLQGGLQFDPWLWNQNHGQHSKFNLPKWYVNLFLMASAARKGFDDVESVKFDDIAAKGQLIPSIFGCVYGSYPLVRTNGLQWGFIVPKPLSKAKGSLLEPDTANLRKKIIQCVNENKMDVDVINDRKPDGSLKLGDFYRLPHKDGIGKNVGSPFSQHFYPLIKNKILRPTRFIEEFDILFSCMKNTSFWTNYKERYESENALWYDDCERDEPRLGAIAPAIVPAGTISRRSVHKLWVTLTNKSDENVLGTGIKSMVQVPKGYRLVGADVDSQEQWLAALYGDASYAKTLDISQREPGLTPFSNMMLAGSKSDGSDLHSVVAKQLKISRDNAKTLNYARLYGSGQKHAAQHLQQTGMPEEEANVVARDLFAITKGTSDEWMLIRTEAEELWKEYCKEKNIAEDNTISVNGRFYVPAYAPNKGRITAEWEEWVLQKVREHDAGLSMRKVAPRLYENYGRTTKLYSGGYESATFNFLEQQAARRELRTPVLDCLLPNALTQLADDVPDREQHAQMYKRSVMNWLVQSSAVDFLHLLLVCMEWLCTEYDIEARFVISIHDEVRFMCEESEAKRVALALMLSNMYVRAYISSKVGIYQLPASVAFFSQIDCDTILRKEVYNKSVNPDGSVVPNGEAWDMKKVLELTNGSLAKDKSLRVNEV